MSWKGNLIVVSHLAPKTKEKENPKLK